jgi:hypothetical protein
MQNTEQKETPCPQCERRMELLRQAARDLRGARAAVEALENTTPVRSRVGRRLFEVWKQTEGRAEDRHAGELREPYLVKVGDFVVARVSKPELVSVIADDELPKDGGGVLSPISSTQELLAGLELVAKHLLHFVWTGQQRP